MDIRGSNRDVVIPKVGDRVLIKSSWWYYNNWGNNIVTIGGITYPLFDKFMIIAGAERIVDSVLETCEFFRLEGVDSYFPYGCIEKIIPKEEEDSIIPKVGDRVLLKDEYGYQFTRTVDAVNYKENVFRTVGSLCWTPFSSIEKTLPLAEERKTNYSDSIWGNLFPQSSVAIKSMIAECEKPDVATSTIGLDLGTGISKGRFTANKTEVHESVTDKWIESPVSINFFRKEKPEVGTQSTGVIQNGMLTYNQILYKGGFSLFPDIKPTPAPEEEEKEMKLINPNKFYKLDL